MSGERGGVDARERRRLRLRRADASAAAHADSTIGAANTGGNPRIPSGAPSELRWRRRWSCSVTPLRGTTTRASACARRARTGPAPPRGRVESVIAASSRESTGVLLIVVALIVAVVQLGPPRANHGSGPRPDALGVGGVNRRQLPPSRARQRGRRRSAANPASAYPRIIPERRRSTSRAGRSRRRALRGGERWVGSIPVSSRFQSFTVGVYLVGVSGAASAVTPAGNEPPRGRDRRYLTRHARDARLKGVASARTARTQRCASDDAGSRSFGATNADASAPAARTLR